MAPQRRKAISRQSGAERQQRRANTKLRQQAARSQAQRTARTGTKGRIQKGTKPGTPVERLNGPKRGGVARPPRPQRAQQAQAPQAQRALPPARPVRGALPPGKQGGPVVPVGRRAQAAEKAARAARGTRGSRTANAPRQLLGAVRNPGVRRLAGLLGKAGSALGVVGAGLGIMDQVNDIQRGNKEVGRRFNAMMNEGKSQGQLNRETGGRNRSKTSQGPAVPQRLAKREEPKPQQSRYQNTSPPNSRSRQVDRPSQQAAPAQQQPQAAKAAPASNSGDFPPPPQPLEIPTVTPPANQVRQPGDTPPSVGSTPRQAPSTTPSGGTPAGSTPSASKGQESTSQEDQKKRKRRESRPSAGRDQMVQRNIERIQEWRTSR